MMELLLNELLWWHWAVAGFVFILAELLLPAFVLVWFGLGAFLVMGAVLLIPDMSVTIQILLWTLSSILMVALWFKVFKRGTHKILIGRSSAHIEGEVGLLTEAVAPFKNGRVRFQKPILGSDNWECIANDTIAAGARVKIVSIEGSLVTVAKADNT
jgi:membrane protein implicated in regulation of membrane protease activity